MLGIYNNSNPFSTYSDYTQNDSNISILEESILTPSFPNVNTTTYSNSNLLVSYIKNFYANNPNYIGGKYIFLRISLDRDAGTQAYKFYLQSSNTSQLTYRPKLKFYYNEISEVPSNLFYRVKYGLNPKINYKSLK